MAGSWWVHGVLFAAFLHAGMCFCPSSVPTSGGVASMRFASRRMSKGCALGRRAIRTSLKMSGGGAVDASVFAAKSEVLAALSGIQDPFRGEGIVKLAAVRDLNVDVEGGKVSMRVELGAPDLKGEVKASVDAAVRGLPWVKDVSINMVALPPQDELREASRKMANGLKGVKNVVACASCKGGVGKSTTSVNLAFSLRSKGYKVGIFDVDIYGPSLPTMVRPERPFNPYEDIVGNEIMPPSCMGVKLMSVGFINPQDSFVLRGAKVSPLVQQLVTTTQWGDLDYLIIDMPPGTGDIHLTLSQMEEFKIDAAVIVTTPQRLSFIDVVKGVEMFDKVGVPSIAVVENMAYLDGPEQSRTEAFVQKHGLSKEAAAELQELLGEKQMLFGQGHRQRLLEMWGIENSFSMPLSPLVAAQGDSGTPYVVAYPDSEVAKKFGELADAVVQEVMSIKKEGAAPPSIVFNPNSREFIINGKQRMPPAELRSLCRSPANDPSRLPPDLAPRDMVPLGKYAISIIWSDGHQSLMPYRAFVEGYSG